MKVYIAGLEMIVYIGGSMELLDLCYLRTSLSFTASFGTGLERSVVPRTPFQQQDFLSL